MQFCCRLSPDRKVNIISVLVLSLLLLMLVLPMSVTARDYHIQASDGETYTITVGEGIDVEDFSIRKLDGQLLTGVTEEERDIAGELYHAAKILYILRTQYTPETPFEDWEHLVREIVNTALITNTLTQMADIIFGGAIHALSSAIEGFSLKSIILGVLPSAVNTGTKLEPERQLLVFASKIAIVCGRTASNLELFLREQQIYFEASGITISIDDLDDTEVNYYKMAMYLGLAAELVNTHLQTPNLIDRLTDHLQGPILGVIVATGTGIPVTGTIASTLTSSINTVQALDTIEAYTQQLTDLAEKGDEEIHNSAIIQKWEGKKLSRTLLEEAGFFPPIITPPLPEGTISHQTLTLGGGSQTIDVAPYFSSENNLDYDAVATPSGIVTGTINGSVITIIPVAAGVATVVVTARDTVTGLTAIQTISVSVRQTGAVPTNTDPTWTPTIISNPRAEGLRVGVSVIVDGLAPGNTLRIRSGAGTNNDIIELVGNGVTGIIEDGPQSANGFTWWKIDWDSGNLEGWSAEVVGGVQLLFRRPPDLEIRDLDVSDSQVGIGEEIELEIEIRNNGPGESDATDVSLYYSDTRHSDFEDLAEDNDLRGGWTLRVPSIREGLTETLTYRVDAPTTPDYYYYGALLSENTDDLDEDAIRNNLAREEQVQVTISPDYIVESISLSGNRTTLDPGGSFTLRATVRNIGLGEPSSSSDLDYYRSSDARISTSDSWVGDDSVSKLDTNETGDESIRLIAPTEPGVYYYGACVSDVSNESDSRNNCSAAIAITVRQVITPVEITGSPDLVISLSSNYSLVDPNGSINLVATVRNQGDADASNSTTLRYYLSTDTIVSSDDQLIATDSVRSLSQGNSDDEDHGIRAPSQPGIYYYYACVDSVTDEDDTGNNCSNVITINVRGSDLVVESISVDLLGQTGSINPNGEFSLNATIRNQGTGNAAATIARYYISTDQTFSTVNDSEVQTASISAINAGASTNAQSTSIRSPYTSGIFYCFVCVDSFSNEIDTGNNCSDPIKITVRNVAPQPAGTISALNIKMRTTAYFVVSNYFSDENNDTLNYSANSSDNNIVKAGISGTQIVITAIGVGSATITITASDGEFNTTQTFTVSITAPNRAPTAIGTISALALTVGDSAKQINVSGNFRDPNGDNLEFTAKSDDDNIATASAAGSTVTITPIKAGSATITVTASDGKLTATQTISVSVVESNSAPTAIGTISERTLTIGDSPAEIDVSSNFSDPDNDKLTYIASSNNTGVATVSVSNSKVTITPKGTGSATITVTASDGTLTTTQTISVTVNDKPVANRVPTAVGTISARTLTVGDSSIQIDVSSNFQDPDDDTLTYSANSDDDSVATASATGSQITITPVGAGTATITVTANDSEFTATQTISVTVTAAPVANRAPFTVGAISARTLTVGDSSIQIDVSSNFQDPDGDTLTFSANSSNNSVATASTIGSIVTITPVGAGNATITVTASDGSLTATQTISVSVESANSAPTAIGTISARTLTTGESAIQIDVASNFSDPDNDTLIYFVNSNNSSVATATASGSQITITPVGAGTATITVTANDGEFTATQTISVTVTSAPVANRTPFTVGAISPQTLTVNDSSIQIDVSSNFQDPDGDSLTYSANSNNESVATASASGSQITITPVSLGTATITVTASDSELTTTQTISVSVESANSAPTAIGTISARTLTTGESAIQIDVASNFSDSDNDTLTYFVNSNNSNVATATASGSQITITPVGAGTATITVTANDGEFTATQTISVTVTAAPVANRAPFTVGAISARTLTVGDSAIVIDVSGNFNDPDNDTLTYFVNSNNNSVATATASGSQITITPVGAGTATITVTANDGEFTATQTISVTVTAALVANRAPFTVGAISARTLTVGESAIQIDVSSNFQDPDGDTLTYSANSSNNSVATASASGSIVTITPVGAGTATITVTASDGSLTATQTISVTVNAANRAPQAVGSIPAQTMTAGDSALLLTVSGFFNDPDGDTLTYTANSSNDSVATVSTSGSRVAINAVAVGSATITVTASDGSLTATQTFSVTVNAANRAPQAVGSIPAQTMTAGDSALLLTVSGFFNDPDGDTLTYTAVSSNSSVATASTSGSRVLINAVAVGSATITVTASDGSLTVTQTISVTVSAANRAPGTVGSIPAQTLTAGGTALLLTVSGYFNDPDGDTLTYSANSSNNSMATVSAIGSIVTITPVGAGTATITVTASDGSLTATQTISVTVNAANRAPTAVGSIPVQTLTAGDSALLLTVSGFFNDPDGDTLTYTANSSNDSVATVSTSGSRVAINAVAVGSATITVTASDGRLTATQTISVTVNAANRAPTAVGSIPAQTLTAGGSALLLTVSGYFNDPDGDTLTYTAVSSNSSVATATATGSQITITPIGAGTVTITVTASDGSLSVTQAISVTVNATVTEETWMPDANLRAAVRSALGLQEGDALTQQALQGLTRLSARSSTISDITGLEYATLLQGLVLDRNQISDISALDELTNLTTLSLDRNQISDISAVDELTNLTYLSFQSNQISDISVVEGLTNLTRLDLSSNQISGISVVEDLTNLTGLYLGSNQISDISAVEELTNLTVLYLYSNQISDISALEELTNLTVLFLSVNQISDISALEELTNLTALHLDVNQISDISAVEELTNLTHLGLHVNQISDISAVEELTNLTELFFGGNQISDISALEELTNLTQLYLYTNQISDISALEDLTALTDLYLSGNPITDYAPLRRLVAAIEADGRSLRLDIGIPPAAPSTQTTPTKTALLPNYPNPFNPETWIPYQLSKSADVTLTIYNVQGVMVRRIALGHRAAGVYYSRNRAAHWDGKNNLGEKVAAGLYFVKFRAGNYTKIRKMLIRK